MQNTFSQSGNDSKWFLKKLFFKIGMWHSRPPRDPPPPSMANAILNFHFDFLHTSLTISCFEGKEHDCSVGKDSDMFMEEEGRFPLIVWGWEHDSSRLASFTCLVWLRSSGRPNDRSDQNSNNQVGMSKWLSPAKIIHFMFDIWSKKTSSANENVS